MWCVGANLVFALEQSNSPKMQGLPSPPLRHPGESRGFGAFRAITRIAPTAARITMWCVGANLVFALEQSNPPKLQDLPSPSLRHSRESGNPCRGMAAECAGIGDFGCHSLTTAGWEAVRIPSHGFTASRPSKGRETMAPVLSPVSLAYLRLLSPRANYV